MQASKSNKTRLTRRKQEKEGEERMRMKMRQEECEKRGERREERGERRGQQKIRYQVHDAFKLKGSSNCLPRYRVMCLQKRRRRSYFCTYVFDIRTWKVWRWRLMTLAQVTQVIRETEKVTPRLQEKNREKRKKNG